MSTNVTKPDPKSICTKIAIQINCKLGGIPWHAVAPSGVMFELITEINMFTSHINCIFLQVMIVGVDEYYDQQDKYLSYIAFVAITKIERPKYFSCVHRHTSWEGKSKQFCINIISKY